MARCEWCRREIIARNRNGIPKRYCSRPCKNAFQTAAVRYTRFLLQSDQISITDLKAAARTAAEEREPIELSEGD